MTQPRMRHIFDRKIARIGRAGCVLACLGCGGGAVPDKQMVVTPLQGAKFVPTDPTRPEATRLAVLWGDPEKGPSAILLELKKGGGRLHVHSSDYHLVLLEGTMKHLAEGERESDVRPLDLGSYWFQPGNQPHSDVCLTDKCLMFIKWVGKRDSKLAEASAE